MAHRQWFETRKIVKLFDSIFLFQNYKKCMDAKKPGEV